MSEREIEVIDPSPRATDKAEPPSLSPMALELEAAVLALTRGASASAPAPTRPTVAWFASILCVSAVLSAGATFALRRSDAATRPATAAATLAAPPQPPVAAAPPVAPPPEPVAVLAVPDDLAPVSPSSSPPAAVAPVRHRVIAKAVPSPPSAPTDAGHDERVAPPSSEARPIAEEKADDSP